MNSLSSDDGFGPSEPVINFKEVNLEEKGQLLTWLRNAYEGDK